MEYPEITYPYLQDFKPSAPEITFSHQEYTNAQEISNMCIYCKLPVFTKEDTTIVPRCLHAYHLRCALDWFSDNPNYCHLCKTNAPFQEKESIPIRYYQKSNQNDNSIPIDYGNDSEVTRMLESRFGKQGIVTTAIENGKEMNSFKQPILPKQGSMELSITQKMAIRGFKDTCEEIDVDFLKKRNITIDRLLKLKVSVATMYGALKLTSWENLLALELKKSHIKQMGLQKIINLYRINYSNLKQDLKMDLPYLIDQINPNALELQALELDFQSLRFAGLNIMQMAKSGYKIEDWINLLGMTKSNLFEMKITGVVITKILKWNVFEVSTAFGLTQKERLSLGINTSIILSNMPSNLLKPNKRKA